MRQLIYAHHAELRPGGIEKRSQRIMTASPGRAQPRVDGIKFPRPHSSCRRLAETRASRTKIVRGTRDVGRRDVPGRACGTPSDGVVVHGCVAAHAQHAFLRPKQAAFSFDDHETHVRQVDAMNRRHLFSRRPKQQRAPRGREQPPRHDDVSGIEYVGPGQRHADVRNEIWEKCQLLHTHK